MEVLQDTYKDTKIGRIPKDWRVLKFREIFNFIITSSHSKNEMVYSETDTEIYNVHYGAIHTTYKEQILDFEKYNVPRITDDSKLPREDQFLKDGDLVIVDASEDWGGMGECVELKNIGSKKVIGGLHTFAVRDKVNSFAKGFAGYIFQNIAVRNKLASFANVSKVYGITKGNISNVPVVIPTLPEQQKIAAILSTVDEQISTADKIIEKSKELKKGLMQKLFSEGVGHTEFKDTKIGRIPKDWEVVRLEEVTSVCSSKRVHRSDYVADGIPFYRSKEIILKSKGLKIKSELYISKEHFNKLKDKYNIPKKGEILITAVGSLGIPYLIKDEEFYFKDGNLIWFRDISININPNYFLYCLNSPKIQNTIKVISGGSSQSALTMVELNKMRILLPNIEEQQKIAAILSEADAKIEKEQIQKAKLEQLKKGLMQQLLTGKKRVKV